MKKKKFQVALSTIIITAGVSYLVQYWLRESGTQDKILNIYDGIKETFETGKK